MNKQVPGNGQKLGWHKVSQLFREIETSDERKENASPGNICCLLVKQFPFFFI